MSVWITLKVVLHEESILVRHFQNRIYSIGCLVPISTIQEVLELLWHLI